jgi:hypothetical protein
MKRSTKLGLLTAAFLALGAGVATTPALASGHIFFGFGSGYGYGPGYGYGWHHRHGFMMRHCNWEPVKIRVWRHHRWVWVWKSRRVCW